MKPGDIIFLSASVPWREQWIGDARPVEIEEAIVSVARAVFAREGRLLFGGHPSVSPLIAAVAGEYFPVDPGRKVRPVVTFQSEFFRKGLPNETWEMVRMGWSAIEWTAALPGDSPREMRAASLRRMRHWMLLGREEPDAPATPAAVIERNGLRPPQMMIAIGGMDGIRDEAAMFLRHRKQWGGQQRVYAFKSGGGAAGRLLKPPVTWRSELWLDETPNPVDLATLQQARSDIVDIEARWWERNGAGLPRLDYQPFAAIAQWLLDAPAGEIG